PPAPSAGVAPPCGRLPPLLKSRFEVNPMTLCLRSLRFALFAALAAAPLFAEDPVDPRSTAATESTVQPAGLPPGPQPPVKAVFAEGRNRHLVEGVVRAGSPAIVLWEAPVGQMLNAQ